MAKVIGIDFESIADGEGVRVVIFFSGCKHGCKGCHNPASHDFESGRSFSPELQDQIIKYIGNTPFISGVTLSGGDPMYSSGDIVPFVRRLRSEIPRASVWVYSGFMFEELATNPDFRCLLELCDVLVDGPFILEQRDMTLEYRGSRNQRILNVQKSLDSGSAVPFVLTDISIGGGE